MTSMQREIFEDIIAKNNHPIFAEIFGYQEKSSSTKKEEKKMSNNVELMVEREELMSKIRIFNIRAEDAGIEKIRINDTTQPQRAATLSEEEKILKLLDGDIFNYRHEARSRLFNLGWEECSDGLTFKKGGYFATVKKAESGYKIVGI